MIHISWVQHVPAVVPLLQIDFLERNANFTQEGAAEAGACFMLHTDSDLASADPHGIRCIADRVSAATQGLLFKLVSGQRATSATHLSASSRHFLH